MSFPLEMKQDIVLASASPRRKQLFIEMGLVIEIFPVEVEEANVYNLTPVNYAEDLARQKAEKAAENFTDKIVIGADTIVVANNEILEKPLHREHARKMLELLSGRYHEVITGVHFQYNKISKTFAEISRVYFKELSNKEINWYLDTGEPFDKAGGYGIQGLGRILISRVEGCYFNVVGFPVSKFYQTLIEFTNALK